MRLWLSGPRILGLRPGVSFRPDELLQRRAAAAQEGGFVYIIRSEDGLLKIGSSNNPEARLKDLNTASPVPLTLAYAGALRCDGHIIEAEAHKTLARYRMNGEWFDCDAEMAVAAISAAAHKLHEPIASVPPALVNQVVSEVARGSALERPKVDPNVRFLVWLLKLTAYFILAIVVFVIVLVFLIEVGAINPSTSAQSHESRRSQIHQSVHVPLPPARPR